MNANNFISGERFQALAEISLIPEGSGLGEKDCDFVIKQQVNNNYNVFYYNDKTTSIPEHVQTARVIFVNNYTLKKFFSVIFPLLTGKYVFISHNSDDAFTDVYGNYLNDKKILKWYSQNKSISHEKLFALPIGIANQQYPHGNLELLDQIINSSFNKQYLVYKNFDIHTNFQARSYINHITSQNGIVMNDRADQTNYLTNLAKSFFCVSPPGNGVDCHRVWECLYLKTVPIIENNSCYEQFKHLPILFIDDWRQITSQNLFKSIEQFSYIHREYTIQELDINYWRNKIYE